MNDDVKIIRRLIRLENIDSTNLEARRLMEKYGSDAIGTMIVSDSQDAAYGRRGVRWHSPPGGLYISFILKPMSDFSFSPAMAVVVAEAIGDETAVKWPNDIYIADGKIGGIMVESSDIGAILGIGINTFSKDMLNPVINGNAATLAISVRARESLLSRLMEQLQIGISLFFAEGFKPFLARFESRSLLKGKRVVVAVGNVNIKGRVMGISDDGKLVLQEMGGGIIKLDTGSIVEYE